MKRLKRATVLKLGFFLGCLASGSFAAIVYDAPTRTPLWILDAILFGAIVAECVILSRLDE